MSKNTLECQRLHDSLKRFMSNLGADGNVNKTQVASDDEDEISIYIGHEYMVSLFVKEALFSLYKLVRDPGTYWDPPFTEEVHIFSNDDHVLVFQALGDQLVKDAVKYQREVELENELFPE